MWVHSIVLIELLFWLDVILVCNWSMFLDNGEVLVARLLFSYFIFFVLFFWPYLHFIMNTKSCSLNQFRAKLLKSWITTKFQLFSLILIDCTGGYSSVFQKDLVLRKITSSLCTTYCLEAFWCTFMWLFYEIFCYSFLYHQDTNSQSHAPVPQTKGPVTDQSAEPARNSPKTCDTFYPQLPQIQIETPLTP